MMNLFTILLLLGLNTISLVTSLNKECRQLKPMQNFVPILYFRNFWYMTHVYYDNEKFDIPCRTIMSEVIFEDILVMDVHCFRRRGKLFYSLYDIDLTQFYYKTTDAKDSFNYTEHIMYLEEFYYGTGKFEADHQLVNYDNGDVQWLRERFTIIDTDYDTYSIIYTCANTTDGKIHSFFEVYARDVVDVNNVNPNVEIVLYKLGLDLEDFESTEGLKCINMRVEQDDDMVEDISLID